MSSAIFKETKLYKIKFQLISREMMFKADVNLGSAGSAGLRERIEEEGPDGVGFT